MCSSGEGVRVWSELCGCYAEVTTVETEEAAADTDGTRDCDAGLLPSGHW